MLFSYLFYLKFVVESLYPLNLITAPPRFSIDMLRTDPMSFVVQKPYHYILCIILLCSIICWLFEVSCFKQNPVNLGLA